MQLKALKGEFKEVLEYANQYISLATLEYIAVWWRVFHSPDAESWCNLTVLAQLLFALQVSNGKLERVYSEIKAIKVERRASLSNETLNNLLIINTDPVPFEDFNPDPAIQMWWDDKVRRTNQKHRSSSTGVKAALVKYLVKILMISLWIPAMSGSFRHKTLTLNCQSFNSYFNLKYLLLCSLLMKITLTNCHNCVLNKP